MSFSIFVQSFQNGRAVNVPDELITKIFSKRFVSENADIRVLEYPDGSRSELKVRKDCPSAGLSFSRPPASLEFWGAVLSILQQTPSCLYWPGGGPVVAQATVSEHLPKSMIEGLGDPMLATSAEQVIEMIKKS